MVILFAIFVLAVVALSAAERALAIISALSVSSAASQIVSSGRAYRATKQSLIKEVSDGVATD